MVRLGSWLITDMTMLIITWSRRIFLASSSRSLRLTAIRSGFSIGPPRTLPGDTFGCAQTLDVHRLGGVACPLQAHCRAYYTESNFLMAVDLGTRQASTTSARAARLPRVTIGLVHGGCMAEKSNPPGNPQDRP